MSDEAKDSGKKKGPSERKSRFSTPVDEDALEFIQAIEDFKKAKDRAFPSWTEVFQIMKDLGYRKVPVESNVD